MLIILASTSKIRKKILEDFDVDFKVVSPPFDEEKAKQSLPKEISAQELALILAKGKALSVSKDFPDSYVIGSDQVCEFEGQNFDKSYNHEEAVSQLKIFNGKTHYQNNAVVVALNNEIIFENNSTVEMQMRKLTDDEIESYVKKDQSWGCAGSYKYESFGKDLFEKIIGDYYSILGLAIKPLMNFLKNK